MRFLATLLLTAGTLSAQIHGARAAGGVTFANASGYGNVAFPGTGSSSFGASRAATGFGRQLPPRNGIGGVGVGGFGGGGRRRGGAGGVGGIGYAYPVFVGGDFGGGYYNQPEPQQQPNITIVNNPPPPPVAPTVVINQYMAPPPDPGASETTHIFQPPSRYPTEPAGDLAAAPAPHYFLIAFKDHSIYSALAYWMEDKTMHYVTPQQTHNQASLDLIDVDLTKKLNQR